MTENQAHKKGGTYNADQRGGARGLWTRGGAQRPPHRHPREEGEGICRGRMRC